MKVLIVVLVSIAKKHITALNSIDPTIEIFALRSSKYAETFDNISNLYSYDEIIKDSFDFIIISNPTSEHRQSIEALYSQNIPLFIEKPLYHSLAIEDLVAKIDRNKIITYIACNLRFLDSICYVNKYIKDKREKINEVNVYCGSYLPDWRKNCDYRNNYSAIPELGGGVHIDLIHELDYLYWMFGNPQKSHRIFSSKSSLEIKANDYANYCLEYPSFNASVVLNYFRRDAKRTMEIVFEDETLLVNLLTNSVHRDNKVIYESSQRITDTYKKQMEYFIHCVNEKKATFNTIKDAYNVLKIGLEQ